MFRKIVVVLVVLLAVCALTGVAMAQDKAKEAPAAAAMTVPSTASASGTAVGITAPSTAAVLGKVNNKFCPVSGAKIADADLGKYTVEYKGRVYNLCSAGCKDEFLKDPEKYVAKVNEQILAEKKASEAAAMPAAENK